MASAPGRASVAARRRSALTAWPAFAGRSAVVGGASAPTLSCPTVLQWGCPATRAKSIGAEAPPTRPGRSAPALEASAAA
ncbi:DUF6053 domain-containing protein [Lysobacter enzymogenes]|uniref:DUF6053 domain-containing protein n=1 Tax=Lysobacter enzymogenes TaxID=69 RepID=UPI003747E8D3